jgi:aspartyl-tRNA(Asn)/glutamyl-tRNA(Gln) amidotransferase subunit C
MAQLDKKMIKYLTQLSRIECTEEEQESLLNDMQKILNYIEQLDEIDTKDVAPCNHVLEDIINVQREDEVGDTMPREIFLSNAPAHVSGLIRVPTVIRQTPK